jgi:hypothetical protein
MLRRTRLEEQKASNIGNTTGYAFAESFGKSDGFMAVADIPGAIEPLTDSWTIDEDRRTSWVPENRRDYNDGGVDCRKCLVAYRFFLP